MEVNDSYEIIQDDEPHQEEKAGYGNLYTSPRVERLKKKTEHGRKDDGMRVAHPLLQVVNRGFTAAPSGPPLRNPPPH